MTSVYCTCRRKHLLASGICRPTSLYFLSKKSFEDLLFNSELCLTRVEQIEGGGGQELLLIIPASIPEMTVGEFS